jgi:hypothetical protein
VQPRLQPPNGFGRFLEGAAAESGRHYDGHDSARLESRKVKASRATGVPRLAARGAFIAIENLIDDERRKNAFGLMMSLDMLIEFGDAFDFTGADFGGWCREAGFKRYEVLPEADIGLGGRISSLRAVFIISRCLSVDARYNEGCTPTATFPNVMK